MTSGKRSAQEDEYPCCFHCGCIAGFSHKVRCWPCLVDLCKANYPDTYVFNGWILYQEQLRRFLAGDKDWEQSVSE